MSFIPCAFLVLLALAHRTTCLQGTWQPLASIAIAPRQEHTTLFVPPDSILLLGGITGDNATTTTNLVQQYSIRKNRWESFPPLPLALNHLNAAFMNDKIYVQRTWRSIAPVPEPRGSAAMGVYDGKVILAGGLKQIQLVSPYVQQTVDSVSIYNAAQNRWVTVPTASSTMPDPRDHACAAVINEHFYVLGGRERGQLKGKGTVLMLDLKDLRAGWTIGPVNMLTPRAGLSCGATGSKIYTFGGEGNLRVDSAVFNEMEVYDVATKTWEELGEMRVSRHGTGAVSVRGKIYVPGGGDVIGIAPVSYFDALVPS
ncbi:galactose oxidase [Lentithecium fluviatile CBS 122367]|uniref:Galactose oxidase n=1 Tax=Lentithecium fluviatile CBS 122367 TaxID=1168545 RepID=A0A6G1IPY7_9PLEO|nr:galactose oxidase [Lentithecium fluviatile CBS 122367]